jgi:hypothetical protein
MENACRDLFLVGCAMRYRDEAAGMMKRSGAALMRQGWNDNVKSG